jgi:hypothetical protein
MLQKNFHPGAALVDEIKYAVLPTCSAASKKRSAIGCAASVSPAIEFGNTPSVKIVSTKDRYI